MLLPTCCFSGPFQRLFGRTEMKKGIVALSAPTPKPKLQFQMRFCQEGVGLQGLGKPPSMPTKEGPCRFALLSSHSSHLPKAFTLGDDDYIIV